MKLTKAIEIQTLMGTPDFQGHTEDILAARKLGIEALKEIHRERIGKIPFIGEQLPGETPEDDPTRSLHHIKEVLESPLGKKPKP